MRETAKLSFRLMLFAMVAGLLLAFVNSATEGTIKRNTNRALNASRIAVLGDYDFEQIDADLSGYDGVTAVYSASENGTIVGYVYDLEGHGYGGNILMTLGIKDGAVAGISVSSHSETKGMGTSAQSPFLESFVGITTPDAAANVDGMSGATVSSNAVKTAVESALRHADEVLYNETGKEGA